MNNRHLYSIVFLLFLLGAGLFAYKCFVLKFPVAPDAKTTVWNLEVRVKFEAKNKPVKFSLFIPKNTRRFALLDENFLSPGYGLTTANTEEGNRQAVWSIRRAQGRQTLYYRAVLRRVDTQEPAPSVNPPPLQPSTLTSPYRESALGGVNK